MRVRVVLVALIVLVVVVPLASRHPTGAEPASAAELALVATQFNREYQTNDVGLVWDRFDADSQAVISRARYELWHRECPRTPGVATTLGVNRVSSVWWVVRYEISEVTLRDYWHQQKGRWRFSLARSNPSAISLYRSSYSVYARAMGCLD
jgi:hypothetical protein